jgi:hypothetical protein
MAKKRRPAPLPRKQPEDSKPNPFEQLYTRKKFDVLGTKAKGATKKITKSRNDASEKVCLMKGW